MIYTFRPVTEEDFPLLHNWYNQKWVAENWDGSISLADIEKKQNEKLKSKKDFPYIVSFDKKPIAYIQLNPVFGYCEGWLDDEKEGTWCIDTFIGRENFLGKGHGPAYMKEFISKVFKERKAKKIIVDPELSNTRAIRAYEKAGFKKVGEIKSLEGVALLMEVLPDES